jgi:hypothetical protein
MTEVKQICTIYLGSPMLDDDYTLYEDGRVKHYYDQNAWSLNNEEWLNLSEITDSIKQKLFDKCPEESKEEVKKLLEL